MWAAVIDKTTNLDERKSDSLRTWFPEVNEISLEPYLSSTMADYFQWELPVTVIYLWTRKKTPKQNKSQFQYYVLTNLSHTIIIFS